MRAAREKRQRWMVLAFVLPILAIAVPLALSRGAAPYVKPGPVGTNGSIIANGVPANLSTAVALSGVPVFRPHDTRADDSSLEQVWAAPNPRQIGLRYASGLHVYLRPSELGDPTAFYESQLREGVQGTLVTINGNVAFVVPPRKEDAIPGSVDMVVKGIEIAIVGYGEFTSDDLIRLAQSVSDSPAPTPTPSNSPPPAASISEPAG
jgi:hypothetical protein